MRHNARQNDNNCDFMNKTLGSYGWRGRGEDGVEGLLRQKATGISTNGEYSLKQRYQ